MNWLNRGKDTKNIQYFIRIEQKSADFIQYDEQNEQKQYFWVLNVECWVLNEGVSKVQDTPSFFVWAEVSQVLPHTPWKGRSS